MRMEGESFDHNMIVRGSLERLAPVLMTALVTAFALAPLLLFEAERPGVLASGGGGHFSGLISSTLLDTFLTPAMFWLFGRKDAERLVDDRDVGAALIFIPVTQRKEKPEPDSFCCHSRLFCRCRIRWA